jgi:uncharacterized protein
MRRQILAVGSIIALICAGLVLPLVSTGAERSPAEANLLQVESVEVRMSLAGPVVLLKVQKKAVPIFVDATVAQSIQSVVSGEKPARPLSHDLMRTILQAFDGRVTRAVITLKGETYYADLTVIVQGSSKVFDSRSSDAIALASHFMAPMFVPKELMDKVGIDLEDGQKVPEGGIRL